MHGICYMYVSRYAQLCSYCCTAEPLTVSSKMRIRGNSDANMLLASQQKQRI